jgi:hypothetical protein
MNHYELNSLLELGYTWEDACRILESEQDDAYDYSRDAEPSPYEDME